MNNPMAVTPARMLREGNKPSETDAYRVMSLAQALNTLKNLNLEKYEGMFSDPDPYGYVQELENELGVSLIDAKWKAYPDDDQWVKRMKSRARKAVITKLFLQGFKTHEIAQQINVSEPTVRFDLQNIENEWRAAYLDDIEVLAAKDMDRLEYYLSRLAPAIELGDVKAINSAVEIIKERGNILGYRHGVQVDIEQYIREVAANSGFDPEKAVELAQRVSISMKV